MASSRALDPQDNITNKSDSKIKSHLADYVFVPLPCHICVMLPSYLSPVSQMRHVVLIGLLSTAGA